MANEFKLPELGENIDSGDVISVLVSAGDTVNKDDPVLELETDKATLEVPSEVTGTIKEVHVQEGDTVEVGQLILTVEDGAGDSDETPSDAAAKEEAPVEEPEEAPVEEKEEEAAAEESTADASGEPQTVEFTLPDLGENIESGTVISVLVSVGDEISKEQGVLEMETDKATLEVPSEVAGTVKEIHVSEGDTPSVGDVILTVETEGKAPAKKAKPEPKKEEKKEEKPAPSKDLETPSEKPPVTPHHQVMPPQVPLPDAMAPRSDHASIGAAPNVRRIAREIGVDITEVSGTGSEGRVTMDDVKRHAHDKLTEAPAAGGVARVSAELPDFAKWGEVRRESMSNIRRATAEQMDRAWSMIPHVTQFDKANVDELEKLRKRFAKRVQDAGGKLTVTAILLKVVAAALKEFPQFNASVDMANQEVVYKDYYHIGVAVDTDRGLLVPVIRDVDRKNVVELSIELGEVAEKARDRKLKLEDMQGGTFTITNLGGIGGTNFTPIVNWPEVAILAVSRTRQEAAFNDEGQAEPRLRLPLSLSYDHRLIDGADGARFLRWIVEYLEQPFMAALLG